MKQTTQSRLAAVVMGMVLGVAAGHSNAQQMAMQTKQAAPNRVIVVSLEDRKLALVEHGSVKKIYPVAVGKPSTPSPAGTFTIQTRVVDPTYSHDGLIVPPGPQNPVGTRWMGLNIRGYGIHGTNAPNSIGKAASHGCIRMSKKDLEELFSMVQVGDTVQLVDTRNDLTAQLFGTPADAQPAATTTMVASSTRATVAVTGSM